MKLNNVIFIGDLVETKSAECKTVSSVIIDMNNVINFPFMHLCILCAVTLTQILTVTGQKTLISVRNTNPHTKILQMCYGEKCNRIKLQFRVIFFQAGYKTVRLRYNLEPWHDLCLCVVVKTARQY